MPDAWTPEPFEADGTIRMSEGKTPEIDGQSGQVLLRMLVHFPGKEPVLLPGGRHRGDDPKELPGLTLAGLAKRFGIDQGDISRMERGSTSPTARALQRIAQTLDPDVRVVARSR